MNLPPLTADRSYEGETRRFYHGFGDTANLDGIVRSGAIESPGRQAAKQDELIATHLYEDVLRHVGEEITTHDLSSGEAIEAYVADHRDDFIEEGQAYTPCAVQSDDFVYDEVPDFLGDHMVWVSRGKSEASNHARKDTIETAERDTGGYVELALPEATVLEFGFNGGVPGRIPLEYAEALYLENVGKDESAEIWIDVVANEYDLTINSIE